MPEIPAHIYDAIVAESEKWGGVGSAQLVVEFHGTLAPCCVLGMAQRALGWGNGYIAWHEMMIAHVPQSEWVGFTRFDQAVNDVREAHGKNPHGQARVPVLEVFARTGVTRGAE